MIRRAFFLLLCSISTFAADLQVRVVDPNSAAINFARVSVLDEAGSRVIAVARPSAEGVATFDVPAGTYKLRVLAPGFAEADQTVTVPQADVAVAVVKLAVAATPETVVVTATASPVTAQETGLAVSTLEPQALALMNPSDIGDALRFVPGATLSNGGRRGGLSTLFVRGGESRYNKVIIDGVPVNDPGGTFDFGVVPSQQINRVELLRGSASTLYGSDAMTSVVQMFTATGTTRVPELRFGADGGTFGTANGYASLAGARGRFDYNVYGEQFNTEGQGVNDQYSNSLQGANLGAQLARNVGLRVRVRHSNARTGVPSNWWFNGNALLPPDDDQYARQNNFLASTDLTIGGPGKWQHRLTGFEYNHRRRNVDMSNDMARPFDDPFDSRVNFNRAGMNYQAEYAQKFGRSVMGYYFEDENGRINSTFESFGFPGESHSRGLRRNHAVYGEQMLSFNRFAVLGGLRYEHNESFGDRAIPRVAATGLLLRGGQVLSGTRLRFSYAQGIKAPTFEESFGISGTYKTNPNPALKPEKSDSIEAGFLQNLFAGRFTLGATYFHNIFSDQIQFRFDNTTFESQYININKALAHGAEIELHGRLSRALSLDGGYVYASTQALETPNCTAGSGCTVAGQALLRRPKHSGNLLLTYATSRWGASTGGTFVGRRPDSDFFFGYNGFPTIDYAAGYARVDVNGWYAINRHITAYVNVGNALNKRYNDVVGYPGLKANYRAGLRFRVGGE